MWTYVIDAKEILVDRYHLHVVYSRESDLMTFDEDYYSATADPNGWPGNVIDAKLERLNKFDETALDAVTVGQPLDKNVVKIAQK